MTPNHSQPPYQSINPGAKGAQLHAGGTLSESPGAYYAPAVLTGVMPEMRAYREELFGPVAVVDPVSSEDEAVRLANDSDYGLGGAVAAVRITRQTLAHPGAFPPDQHDRDSPGWLDFLRQLLGRLNPPDAGARRHKSSTQVRQVARQTRPPQHLAAARAPIDLLRPADLT